VARRSTARVRATDIERSRQPASTPSRRSSSGSSSSAR
jgi:hypothetical protein